MENAKTLDSEPRAVRRPAWTGLLLLALATLAACARDTPETALRMQLQRMQTAAAERRAGDFMEGVAADFVGNEGMDRAALHNLMRAQVLGNSTIGVTMGPVEIEQKAGQATLRFTALLTGGQGRFIPDSAQTYSITSGWRLEDGEWRVYYAHWKPSP
ncbi:MAG: nuclear transport factor 2 family protein [Pseudoxanthomonas sp.]